MDRFRRQHRTHEAAPWLCVALITFIAVQPLFGQPPRGADTFVHFYRVPVINSLLQHGVLFSRWSPDLVFGYGYPLFNFYPPLTAYILTLTYWLSGQNALIGWNVAFGLALVLTSLGMFGLGRRLFGNMGGIVATAAYTLSPYVVYQTFERSSLSNAWALACLPYAVWALVELATAPSVRRGAWVAIAVASIFLVHTSTSVLMLGPLVAAGLVMAYGVNRRFALRRFWPIGLAILLGLALSAFIWLPALSEIQFTRYQEASRGAELIFANLLQWPQPAIDRMANPDLTLSVGLLQLVLGLTGSGVAVIVWIAQRRSPRPGTFAGLIALSGLIALLGLFFATAVSSWLWKNWSLLNVFQFPVRWLDLPAFWLALPCGWMAQRLITRSGWRIALGAAGLVVLVANVLPYLYPLRWEDALPAQPTLEDQTQQAQIQYGMYGVTSWGEYAPATVKTLPTAVPFPGADLGATLDQKLQRAGLPADAVLSAAGGPTNALVQLNLTRPSPLIFYVFYFPGWMAELDGRSIAVGPDEAGLIKVNVPSGQHTLSIYFGETPVRLASDLASIGAAVLIGLALLAPNRGVALKPKWVDQSDRLVSVPDRTSSALAIWCAVLGVLVVAKVAWFDRVDSPLVQHVSNGQVPGAIVPALSDFGGELKLLGYRWDAPDRLNLYWQAERVPSRNYRVEVTLVDARGVPSGKVAHASPGYMLTSRWEAGQLVRDDYVLPLDESQRPIGYHLTVAVLDPVNKQPLALIDSPDAVQSVALGETKLVPASRPDVASMALIGAQFDGQLELERAALPDQIVAGATLSVTLLWRSIAATSIDYTVFIHLLDEHGALVATGDGQPRKGLYPTSFWSSGEQILDEHSWSVQMTPGDYQVEVGVYRLDTGERLIAANGADHVLLKTLHVTPAS